MIIVTLLTCWTWLHNECLCWYYRKWILFLLLLHHQHPLQIIINIISHSCQHFQFWVSSPYFPLPTHFFLTPAWALLCCIILGKGGTSLRLRFCAWAAGHIQELLLGSAASGQACCARGAGCLTASSPGPTHSHTLAPYTEVTSLFPSSPAPASPPPPRPPFCSVANSALTMWQAFY